MTARWYAPCARLCSRRVVTCLSAVRIEAHKRRTDLCARSEAGPGRQRREAVSIRSCPSTFPIGGCGYVERQAAIIRAAFTTLGAPAREVREMVREVCQCEWF